MREQPAMNYGMRLAVGLMLIVAVWMAKTATATDTAASATSIMVSTETGLAPELPWAKPVWMTDLSLTVSEGYDDNVFCAGANPASFPSYTVPVGSVAAIKNQCSFVTIVTPKIGVNLAPERGRAGFFNMLGLVYAPEIANYDAAPSEDYQAHAVATTINGKSDAFSLSVANTFTCVRGSKYGPTYPGNLLSAWSTAGNLIKRRDQNKDANTITMQYDFDKLFVRPVASLLYYDMQTRLIDSAGYNNYASRNDLNGGLDLGEQLNSQLAATIGYRYGHQYQQHLVWTSNSSPNDYQRVLLGVECKPVQWLTLQCQAGPDFRAYAPDTAIHHTPVNDINPVVIYGEGRASALLSRQDTLTFSFKRFRWLSSLGCVPYDDSSYSLNYTRRLSDKLTLSLGGLGREADYVAPTVRDDWLVNLTGGLNYAFNTNFNASLDYAADLGINAIDASQISGPASNREFKRNILSVSLVAKF